MLIAAGYKQVRAAARSRDPTYCGDSLLRTCVACELIFLCLRYGRSLRLMGEFGADVTDVRYILGVNLSPAMRFGANFPGGIWRRNYVQGAGVFDVDMHFYNIMGP